MSVSRTNEPNTGHDAAAAEAPVIVLRSLRGPEDYMVTIEENLLGLTNQRGQRIMTVPIENVARHVHFGYDLRHGMTASFVLVAGMKSYRFKCPAEAYHALRAVLPSKTRKQVAREVRLTGLAFVALGALLALSQGLFHWGWASALAGMGLLGAVVARRRLYAANAALLFAFAFTQMFLPLPAAPGGWRTLEHRQLAVTVAACVALCLGVQQVLMLDPNQQIRVARLGRDGQSGLAAQEPSELVRRIAITILGGSAALGLYSLTAWVQGTRLAPAGVPLLGAMSTDMLVAPILAALTLAIGLRLALSKKPVYAGAKVGFQLLIVIAVFFAYGAIHSLLEGDVFGLAGRLLQHAANAVVTPYIWVTLLALIVAFNRGYATRVDRELDESD